MAIIHLMDMHYGWRHSNFFNKLKIAYLWFTDIFKNEITQYINILLVFGFIGLVLYHDNEALSFEIFM